ncbi:MAG: DNA-methyltransferase [Minisyncoccia bacterium]
MENKVIQGDCLEVMKDIPDKSIDMILTDPPYLFIKGGMKSKTFNVGKNKPDSFMVNKMSDFGEKEIIYFLDSTKPKLKTINYFIFCSKLQLIFYLSWANNNKLNYDICIWDKMSGSLKSKKFLKPCDYIIRIYGKGSGLKYNLNNIFYEKIKRYKSPNKYHQAEKPVELIEDLLFITTMEGNTVLDPFAGSGTTGVACKNLNRNYILIEKEPEYIDIINKRLAHKTITQESLF